MKRSRWILSGIALFALALPAFGDIYRWEGDDGVAYFSNRPPPPGVAVIDRIEEAPYDAEADLLRQEEDRRVRQEFEKRVLEERRAALAAREREVELKLLEAERLLEQSRQHDEREADCDESHFFRYGRCGTGLIIHRHSGRSGPRDLYRGVYRDNNNLYYKKPEHRPRPNAPLPPGKRPSPGDPTRRKPRDMTTAAVGEKSPAAGESPKAGPSAPGADSARRK
jgi:hypothetical protein